MNQPDSNARAKREGPARGEHPQAARWRRESIQFLIALAATNPTVLASSERPGDLLNLAAGLYRRRFILLKTADPRTEISRLAEKLRAHPKCFRSLVRSTKRLLAAAADKTHFGGKLMRGTAVMFQGAQSVQSGRRHFIISPTGPHGIEGLEQAVIVGSMFLLNTKEGEMVRRCARSAPVCARIFLATRPKQIFCGRTCASAAAFERYKAEALKKNPESWTEEHRRIARKSYRKRRKDEGYEVRERRPD